MTITSKRTIKRLDQGKKSEISAAAAAAAAAAATTTTTTSL